MTMSLRTIACSILLVFLACVSCKSRKPLFVLIPSSESGIHFNNTIVENDSINPSDMINVYNGGGVGIGNFKFEDITESAGVGGAGKWCKGVAVVDINNDGWPDIYVCASISRDPDKRRNLLYINQGNGPDGIPHFKEMAAAYGLDDTTHSTMAAFFDYDNDGDLDMYLVVNENIRADNPHFFRPILTDGSHRSTRRLYRNDWSDSLKHPVFTNFPRPSGILTECYWA